MNFLLRIYPQWALHGILENGSSHCSKEVQEWHQQPGHDRVIFHFVPTFASWLNSAEIFLNLLQAKVPRRGVFPSKRTLVQAVLVCIDKSNRQRCPFQ